MKDIRKEISGKIDEKKRIQEVLSKHLQFKYMEEDAGNWIKIENSTEMYVPVNYAYFFVQYQNTYFSDVYDSFIDLSIVIYNGGIPAGIWPLSLYCRGGRHYLGSWGGELLPPLLLEKNYNTESIRKMLRKCGNAMKELCFLYGVSKYTFRETPLDEGNSKWFQIMMEGGACCEGVNSECFVDIGLTEDEILSRIRRTNKYSILKGLDYWKTKLISCADSEAEIAESFERFRKLHIQVAGRETRSKSTWKIQEEAVKNTNDFAVMLYDREDHLVGASLFSTTASACTYSVAAYRRELFDKPLGHVSQWAAIKHMGRLGIRWYYLGARSYQKDWNHPTEKELSIGHFKEGFATNLYHTLHIDVCVG